MKPFIIAIGLLFCSAVFAEEKKAPESKPAETRPAAKTKSKQRYFGLQDSVMKNILVHGFVQSSIPMKKLEMCFAYMQPFWVGLNDQRSGKKCVALNNGNTLCPGNLDFGGQNNNNPFSKYFKFDKGVFGNKNIFFNENDDYVGFIEVESPASVSIAVSGVKSGVAKVAIKKWKLVWEEKVLDIATGISQSYFVAKAKVQVKKGLIVNVYIYYDFHLDSDSYRYDQIRCYAAGKNQTCQVKW